jgi:cobalt-zinc-cadmium efflux system protein
MQDEEKVKHTHLKSRGRRMVWVILLNTAISIAEVIGGVVANSLSLLSDAVHNVSDVLATVIAWIAIRVGGRKSTLARTFGFKRIEILAALLNSLILVAISVYLLAEAWSRFQHPSRINGAIMFIVASFGFLANFFGVVVLKKESAESLNIKAAYLHLLGDAISSLAVIAGGILIYYFDVYWIDPLVTVLISVYILIESYRIVKKANDILMQGAPASIDLLDVKKDLESLPEIANIHHVHAWNMDETNIHFECHADLSGDIPISQTTRITQKIKVILREKYGIRHATIQYEFDSCHDKSMISH